MLRARDWYLGEGRRERSPLPRKYSHRLSPVFYGREGPVGTACDLLFSTELCLGVRCDGVGR